LRLKLGLNGNFSILEFLNKDQVFLTKEFEDSPVKFAPLLFSEKFNRASKDSRGRVLKAPPYPLLAMIILLSFASIAAVTLTISERFELFISIIYILFTARSQARSSRREHRGFFSLSFLLSGQKG